MPSTWPKLADVRSWLRLAPDATEDGVIDAERVAAIDYALTELSAQSWATLDATDVPDQVVRACVKDAAHLYRRRDSLDGTIGWGDLGIVRVGGHDPDVDKVYGHFKLPVFG